MKNLLAEHVSVTNMKKKEIKKGANTFYVIKLKAEHKRDGFTKIKEEVTN